MSTNKEVMAVDNNIWYDVLKAWCGSEIVEEFHSLSIDAKNKMLDALKGTVMHMLMYTSTSSMLSNMLGGFLMVSSHSASEELLNRAVRSEGALVSFSNFFAIQYCLNKWGRVKGRHQILQDDEEAYLALHQNDKNNIQLHSYTTDQTITKSGSKTRDISIMKKILVKDLRLYETSEKCYIEGTLTGNPRLMVGLTVILEDDDGDVIQTALYNVIPQGTRHSSVAETLYPRGTKIRIIEPFMKIFRDGNRGIRVDDPSDVCILSETEEGVESIRRRGKEYMELEEHLLAFELYYKGVQDRADSVISLLNNRCEAEIKLNEFEEALLDAAAVLFLRFDARAQQVHQHALQRIEYDVNTGCFRDIWMKVLQKYSVIKTCSTERGTEDAGDKLFAEGKFGQAKRQYTSALSHPDICLLLTNVAITSIKLNMFQTAIAAASTCLRISKDTQRRQKAIYAMSQSFLMLGEVELYKISSTQLSQRKELDKLQQIVKNTEDVFIETMKQCCTKFDFQATGAQYIEFCSKSNDLVCDFLKPNCMEHVYIDGKGRGVKATRDIKIRELLIVDHPVAYKGSDITEAGMVHSFDYSTKTYNNAGHVTLVAKLLNVIRYDAILVNKLRFLETRQTADDKKLPLIDMDSFAYRKLNKIVLPFLSQTSFDWLDKDTCDMINESYIHRLLDINAYEYDADQNELRNKGCALCLRISLFNHSKQFNCRVIPFGQALVLAAKENIPKGTELTIQYGEDVTKWGITEP